MPLTAKGAAPNDLRKSYVYVLFRPWDGSPCYIGKGVGNRWLYHERCGAKNQRRAKRRATMIASWATPERQAKQSAATKRQMASPEARARVAENNRKRIISDTTREKLRVALRDRMARAP